MPNDGAQGTLSAIGAAVSIAGIGVLQSGTDLLTGLILLFTGVGMISARAYLRFITGTAPE